MHQLASYYRMCIVFETEKAVMTNDEHWFPKVALKPLDPYGFEETHGPVDYLLECLIRNWFENSEPEQCELYEVGLWRDRD